MKVSESMSNTLALNPAQSQPRKMLNYTLLAGLTIGIAIFIFSMIKADLFATKLWNQALALQFKNYTITFIVLTGCMNIFFRQNLKTSYLSGLMIYLVLAFGIGGVAANLLYFTSSYCLGALFLGLFDKKNPFEKELELAQIIMMLVTGMAIGMSIVQILGHSRINSLALHLCLMSIPIFLQYTLLQKTGAQFTAWLRAPTPSSRGSLVFITTLLLFILCWQIMYASRSESGNDALTDHMMQAFDFARNGRFDTDFKHKVVVLMPLGGESIYGLLYLLGGESAARLVNFLCCTLTVTLIYSLLAKQIKPFYAILVCCVFASIPLTFVESATNFIENPLQLFITASFVSLILLGTAHTKNPVLIPVFITNLFAGLSVKLLAAFYIVPSSLIFMFYYIKRKYTLSLKSALILSFFIVAFMYPYINSLLISGNPVFPFMNNIFKSPYFPPDNFTGYPYPHGIGIKNLYLILFTGSCFEGYGGVAGTQFVILLIASLLLAIAIKPRIFKTAFIVSFTYFILIGMNTNYSRYIYPIFPLLVIAMAAIYYNIENYTAKATKLLLAVSFLVIGLNIYLIPSAGSLLWQADLQSILDPTKKYVPLEFKMNEYINTLSGKDARVLYLAPNSYAYGLMGKSYYNHWFNGDTWKNADNPCTVDKCEEFLHSYQPNYVLIANPEDNKAVEYIYDKRFKMQTKIGNLLLYSKIDT
jgi:4-amino-4-deoxy-L-arabinose transferase-like glycosyltransferase